LLAVGAGSVLYFSQDWLGDLNTAIFHHIPG
jgi:hypothetical protein